MTDIVGYPIAVEGERAAVIRQEYSPRRGEVGVDVIVLLRHDVEDRLARMVIFELDQLDEALAMLRDPDP